MSEELGEFRIVKVADIVVEPARNPRGEITGEDVVELAASIRENGLNDPVTCAEGPNGLELVAGYRRVAACKEAEVAQIPVYVRDAARRDTYALIENLLRQDMAPIAEARAMGQIARAEGLNQKALAKRLGKSPSFVAERLRMLRLPDAVQEVLAGGRPGISSVPALQVIADVCEPAAVRVAQMTAAEEEVERALRDAPARVLARLERQLAEERGTIEIGEGRTVARPPAEGELVVLEIGRYVGTDVYKLAISEERRAELARRIAALEGREPGSHPAAGEFAVALGERDIDALRALGVLLEYGDEDGFYVQRFCFDSEAVLDRVELTLAETEAEAKAAREAELERAREEAASKGREVSADADPAKVLAERRREARAEELREAREKRGEARRVNLELGRRLLRRRARKRSEKRRRELIRALALHAVCAEDRLAGLGPRLVYESWQEVEQKTLKSGKPGAVKVKHLKPREASGRLRREIEAAKSADEILDAIGDALVAAVYASEEELAVSRRVCGHTGRLRHGAHGPLRRAIDEEAKGALPPELVEELRRSRERGYEEPELAY
jgi:ParB family chromosome partitioning protein